MTYTYATLEDLKLRLAGGAQNLEEMAVVKQQEAATTQAVSRQRDIAEEVSRLRGKAEGVRLAISYVDESIRSEIQATVNRGRS